MTGSRGSDTGTYFYSSKCTEVALVNKRDPGILCKLAGDRSVRPRRRTPGATCLQSPRPSRQRGAGLWREEPPGDAGDQARVQARLDGSATDALVIRFTCNSTRNGTSVNSAYGQERPARPPVSREGTGHIASERTPTGPQTQRSAREEPDALQKPPCFLSVSFLIGGIRKIEPGSKG